MRHSSSERRFLNRLKLFDPCLALIVWLAIYEIRFRFFPAEEGLRAVFVAFGVLLAFVTAYAMSREGLYQSRRLEPLTAKLMSLVRAHITTLALFVVVLYFFAERRLSRSVILLYAVSYLILQIFLRVWIHERLKSIWSRGQDLLKVLFVGDSSVLLKDLAQWQSRRDRGVQVVAWLDDGGRAEGTSLASPLSWSEARERLQPDLVVMGYSAAQAHRVGELLRDQHNDVIPIHVLPEIPYSILGMKSEMRGGVPVLAVNQPDFPAVDLFVKRLFDLVGALAGLVLLSPLLMLIALGVKLSSPGPVLFGQERVGLDGRRFRMWKFRSMRVSAESEATWTTKDDPRKTRFGNFLRKTSLDELPQLWNIFVGEMSIVGPRPEQPRYVDKFRHEIPAYMLRHKMKAGLTGWAQVNGWRGDTDLGPRIECDLYYIRNWSLWFDLKIVFLTLFKGFINRNAY